MFLLTHQGVTQAVEEWALDYGITPELIEHRMAHGWNTAAAIETPMEAPKGWRLPDLLALTDPHKGRDGRGAKPSIFLEHDGRTLSLSEWSDRLGVSRTTLDARRRRGMKTADILASSSGRGGYLHRVGAGDGKQLQSNSRETGAPVTRKIASK